MIKSQEPKEGYIKFDKKLIQVKQLKKRLFLIMSYLKIYSSMSGYIGLTIDTLVEKIGYKIDRHDGKINDIVRNTLTELEKQGDIYILEKLVNIKNNNFFIIQINDVSDLFYPESDYVILNEKEFTTITAVTTDTVEKCDKQELLNVYLNIKKFINMGKGSDKFCYPSHITLCRNCNISSTGTMNKLILALVSMGVLFTYNSGQYEDIKGSLKYANSFYAVDDKVLNPEKCDDIIKSYYNSQGITVERFIKTKEI